MLIPIKKKHKCSKKLCGVSRHVIEQITYDCYSGQLPGRRNCSSCRIRRYCWFYGLLPYKST